MKDASLPFMVRRAHHERPVLSLSKRPVLSLSKRPVLSLSKRPVLSPAEGPVRPEPVEGGRARSFCYGLLATLTLLASLSAAAANPQVELKTSMGTVVIELYPDQAPLTVDNFLKYVNDRHYDGTVFHRVIPGFMIQGGGFGPDFIEKPARKPVRK